MTGSGDPLSRRARRFCLAAALLLTLAAAHFWATAPARALVRNQAVADIVQRVDQDQFGLRTILNQLTGAASARVGGVPYLFLTRYATSGTPIDKAEQYVYEHLRAAGLDSVKYQAFAGIVRGRNVIGQITGEKWPAEVVVLCAHLDSKARPDPRRAPGADDDGSSVAALLELARVFSQYHFDRTVRFVFFGGEEQGLVGSAAYALAARQSGQNIVAVVNADMIGWNGLGGGVVALRTRPSVVGNTDIWTAMRYVEAVQLYAIGSLAPRVIKDAPLWSDHASFWRRGYPATCLIEDHSKGDNPTYHTSADTVARLTWAYYVRVTKGLAATAAHLGQLHGTQPSRAVYVYAISLSSYSSAGVRGPRASVRVYDASLTPVQGATVRAAFTGTTVSSRAVVTDAYGRAVFSAPTHAGGGSWTFAVSGVSKRGWVYDAALNRVTSGVITIPGQ